LNLRIEPGEVFGLLGPNVAGKTTTIKMLNTLIAPTSGKGWVGGHDVVEDPSAVRNIIGYVPQAISTDGSLTGYENLLIFSKLFMIPRSERRERIDSALRFMDLEGSEDKLVREYSGGMVRRLEMALSMLHRPQILFLDEPTVGLDPLARRSVWEHVNMLREEKGMTIFLTTHMMEEAASLCSRVGIMSHGTLLVTGTPDQLIQQVRGESMDDVYAHFVGATDVGGDFADVRKARRRARRMG
jgi:ABC-2 type transport system ATP-binding protein